MIIHSCRRSSSWFYIVEPELFLSMEDFVHVIQQNLEHLLTYLRIYIPFIQRRFLDYVADMGNIYNAF